MTKSGDVKSFFRQQKAHTSAATKPTGGVSKKAAAAAHHHHQKPTPAVHVGPAPDHGADARRQQEELRERTAREFDMDMQYGPCLGLTRAQRWRRADALGLAPPLAILALCGDGQSCLWEGRI